MLTFERSSLNQKLTIMSSASAATALLVVFVAFAVASVVAHRKDEAMQLSSFAGLIGANSVDALQLGDRALARATLSALKANVDISHAALYDRQGAPFAAYRKGQAAWAGARPGAGTGTPAAVADPHPKVRGKAHTHTPSGPARTTPAAPPDDASPFLSETGMVAPLPGVGAAELATANLQGQRFWSTRMRWYQPVTTGAGPVGAVMIEADLSTMWLDIFNSLGVMLGAMAGALAVALVLAARFKRGIAAPVTELIDAARQVAHSQDYSLRVAHRRNDELGTLIDSFNTMLAQIEDRGAELTGHRDALERQVGIRTAQLEKAKNAAEAASCAKSAFLATMSHEIRTPMNGVLGMTEMLLGTELSDMQREFTHLVKRSGEHLLVIINDILDFSKIEAGKLSVEYINFNLWDLLDDIHTVYTPQAQAKRLGLDFDIANDIPVAICGDPNRLRQVIANLLGNAIKFTETGRILATVRVASENAQAVDLRFEVVDTGIGVSSEARGRIFEAFSQADDSTTRKYGGTGLGLAIAKQLVELMGGKIGVDNGLQQGAVFWFTVSFDKRRVEPDTTAGQPALRGLRVLVIDEQPASRAALARQLASWKVAASCAVSALDGIERLRAAVLGQQPFDAAIIDMELARTSGLALAAAIKGDGAIRATRLLLISPNRLAADQVQRRAAGVAYQLTKPARGADLYACLAARPRMPAPRGVAPQPCVPTEAAPAMSVAARPDVAGMRAAARTGALPMARVALTDGRALSRRGAARHAPEAGVRNVLPSPAGRVLLAEDNPVNVEVAKAMLASLGLSVHCARHGAEALAAWRAQHFDAVLMDCQMPVMDGFAATAAIRALERDAGARDGGRASAGRPIPIIAITANALQGDREACLAAGMDDYLSKPFAQQDLRAVLERWTALPTAAPVRDAGAMHHQAVRTTPGQGVPLRDAAQARLTPASPCRQDAGTGMASRNDEASAATPRPGPDLPAPRNPATTAATAINERALDAIRALSSERGGALVHKVITTWVDDTPQRLDGMRAAIAAHDARGVRTIAHGLKSASANVGADQFARLCRQLEQLGRDDTLVSAAGILNDMEQEFQAVRHSLNAILEKET